MIDGDAQAIARLVRLYGPWPILERMLQVVRAYHEQDAQRWGNEKYRMLAVVKAWRKPSPLLNHKDRVKRKRA
jgi:hypothetical protein